jgi:hypothetical protein
MNWRVSSRAKLYTYVVSAFHTPSTAVVDVHRCWLSRPTIGKHMSFDGRYIHAAPSVLSDLWASASSSSNSRDINSSSGSSSADQRGQKRPHDDSTAASSATTTTTGITSTADAAAEKPVKEAGLRVTFLANGKRSLKIYITNIILLSGMLSVHCALAERFAVLTLPCIKL